MQNTHESKILVNLYGEKKVNRDLGDIDQIDKLTSGEVLHFSMGGRMGTGAREDHL